MATGWTDHIWVILKETKLILEEHWFVFAGAAGALWAAAVRLKRRVLAQYVTIDQMGDMERRLSEKIDRVDIRNTDQHIEIRSEIKTEMENIYQAILRLFGSKE